VVSFQRSNAGISRVQHPGDYANPIPTTPATAPSLRNIAVTGPYMHDGSVATLEEVIDIYASGGRNVTSGPASGDGRLNAHKSELIVPIDLSEQEKRDLVAFLKTLTDEEFLNSPRFSDPWEKKPAERRAGSNLSNK
jgi:cytochrome c peroxidase